MAAKSQETPSTENADNGALRWNAAAASKADPSPLTTQQLLRENFWLRELLETRINGMDKAIMLLQAFADRTPTTMDIQHEVVALREVTMEMFRGVKTQFQERDTAVNAAFASADKAINKTETGFKEQIGEQGRRIESVEKKSDEKVDDLKQRMTATESRTAAITQQKAETGAATTQNTSQVANIAAMAFGALMFLLGAGSLAVSVSNSRPVPVPTPQVIYAQPPVASSVTPRP